jgi:hypothetical protein
MKMVAVWVVVLGVQHKFNDISEVLAASITREITASDDETAEVQGHALVSEL